MFKVYTRKQLVSGTADTEYTTGCKGKNRGRFHTILGPIDILIPDSFAFLRAARTSFGSLRYIARGLFEGLAAGKSVA
jgi:hypothetical protein